SSLPPSSTFGASATARRSSFSNISTPPAPLRRRSPDLAKRLAQEFRAFQPVAPGQVGCLANADADARCDFGPRVGCAQFEGGAMEPQAVRRMRDGERLAEPARARAQKPLLADAAPAFHRGDPLHRLERADQDRARRACRLADEIHAPMDAVGSVDI